MPFSASNLSQESDSCNTTYLGAENEQTTQPLVAGHAGAAIPLEYNLDWLHGVSFGKGCYIGQELVARTHFGGLIRKRLFPVLLDAADNIEEATNSEIFAEGKAKSIGSVRGVCGNVGLAHLRVDDALNAQQKHQPLKASICGRQVPCAPQIPFWWPQADITQS